MKKYAHYVKRNVYSKTNYELFVKKNMNNIILHYNNKPAKDKILFIPIFFIKLEFNFSDNNNSV